MKWSEYWQEWKEVIVIDKNYENKTFEELKYENFVFKQYLIDRDYEISNLVCQLNKANDTIKLLERRNIIN